MTAGAFSKRTVRVGDHPSSPERSIQKRIPPMVELFFGDPYGIPRLRAGRGTALTCSRQVIHSRALRVPKGVYKIRSPTNGGTPYFGDPYGTRTHVTAVKGRCLNHLTNGPYKKRSKRCALFGSGTWIRTGDTSGMNRMLWPTELCRHCYVNSIRNIPDLTRLVNTKRKIFFAFLKK